MRNNSEVRWVPVGELGEVRMGKQLSPSSSSGGQQVPYLRVANVYEGRIDLSDVKTMRFTEAERRTYSLRAGDILLNEGQSIELVGRSALYDQRDGEFCFQNHLIRFRPGPTVLPQYAQLIFRRWLLTGVFARVAKKTTSIAHLGSERFAAMKFPVIPFPAQERVVQVLGSVSDAMDVAGDAVRKLRELRMGVLAELAGIRLVDFSCVVSSGPQNGIYKPAAEYGVNGTPIVRITSFAGGPSDLSRGLLRVNVSGREVAHYGLAQGDILINRVNTPELVGKSTSVTMINEPTVFESNVMRCKIDRRVAIPGFVEAWLSSPAPKAHFMRRAKSAVSQASINRSDVLTCPFPDLDVSAQESFLERLSAIEARVQIEIRESEKLGAVSQGLQDELLGDQVTVRGIA